MLGYSKGMQRHWCRECCAMHIHTGVDTNRASSTITGMPFRVQTVHQWTYLVQSYHDSDDTQSTLAAAVFSCGQLQLARGVGSGATCGRNSSAHGRD